MSKTALFFFLLGVASGGIAGLASGVAYSAPDNAIPLNDFRQKTDYIQVECQSGGTFIFEVISTWSEKDAAVPSRKYLAVAYTDVFRRFSGNEIFANLQEINQIVMNYARDELEQIGVNLIALDVNSLTVVGNP